MNWQKNITTVWIVQPKLKSDLRSNNDLSFMNEAIALTEALPGSKLIGSTIIKVEKISPKEFFGKGKVEELVSVFKLNSIELVIINSQISAIQQQNLEKNGKLRY